MEWLDDIQSLIRSDIKSSFDQQDYEDLRVAIRIAGEFKQFLDKYDREPPAGEIVYITDTIRSGMDQFFALAHSCSVLAGHDADWQFHPFLDWNYQDLRRRFLSRFEDLSSARNIDGLQKLACLLELTHLELAFLAAHFPLSIFRTIAQNTL